jgi:hypothetical protein
MSFIRLAMIALLLSAVGLLAISDGDAVAQNLSTKVAATEQRVSALAGEVAGRQQQLDAAAARYEAAAQRTAPLVKKLDEQRADVQQLQADLVIREKQANTRISQLNKQHQQEVDDHDREVRSGIGFGLAALVAGFIAIAWGWFRATDAVAALTRIDLGQAIGVCVGSGLLLVIVGVALGSSNGAAGAIGSFLFCLGLILPVALLLARHSAEVQRGRSKPLLRRERLPNWISIVAAGLMGVLFLASTGSAIFADGAASQPVPQQLREEAQAASEGEGAEDLEVAKEEVVWAKQRAATPLVQRNAAQKDLEHAQRELRSAKRRLASVQSSQRSLMRRMAALEARERREAEREASRLAREEEESAEQAEEELAAECHPSYSGCLDPSSPDYDCEGGSGNGPDYTSTVEVIGYDEYGLDDDGDGIGCDLG